MLTISETPFPCDWGESEKSNYSCFHELLTRSWKKVSTQELTQTIINLFKDVSSVNIHRDFDPLISNANFNKCEALACTIKGRYLSFVSHLYLKWYARLVEFSWTLMVLRQLCKETGRRPLKALFFFPEERWTGIEPTRLIVENDVPSWKKER